MRRTVGLLAALALTLAGCGWAHPRSDTGNTGHNLFETEISAANVAGLTEQFRLPSGTSNAVPAVVVARGHAYVGGSPIRVFDAMGVDACGGSPRTCSPQWSLDQGGAPDVYDSTLYRGGNAYDADGTTNCSGVPKVCTETWQEGVGSAPPGATDPAKLHLQGHRSYAGHGASESVSAYGYDTVCPVGPADCPLRWAGALGIGGAGGVLGGPALGGTSVFASYSPVGSPHGTLMAFDGTQGSAPVLWTATLPGVGSEFVAVADGVVVTTVQQPTGPVLVAYDAAGQANCTGSPVVCEPLWASDPWTGAGTDAAPAIANGVVYRAVGTQLRAYDLHGSTGCAGVPKVCNRMWSAAMGSGITAPAVAGGLVFVGDATGHVDAFDAAGFTGCSATTRLCGALWDTSVGVAVGAPEVVGGRVYVPAADGDVHVYGLPSS